MDAELIAKQLRECGWGLDAKSAGDEVHVTPSEPWRLFITWRQVINSLPDTPERLRVVAKMDSHGPWIVVVSVFKSAEEEEAEARAKANPYARDGGQFAAALDVARVIGAPMVTAEQVRAKCAPTLTAKQVPAVLKVPVFFQFDESVAIGADDPLAENKDVVLAHLDRAAGKSRAHIVRTAYHDGQITDAVKPPGEGE